MLLAAFLKNRGLLNDESFTTIVQTAILGYPAANLTQQWMESRK